MILQNSTLYDPFCFIHYYLKRTFTLEVVKDARDGLNTNYLYTFRYININDDVKLGTHSRVYKGRNSYFFLKEEI